MTPRGKRSLLEADALWQRIQALLAENARLRVEIARRRPSDVAKGQRSLPVVALDVLRERGLAGFVRVFADRLRREPGRWADRGARLRLWIEERRGRPRVGYERWQIGHQAWDNERRRWPERAAAFRRRPVFAVLMLPSAAGATGRARSEAALRGQAYRDFRVLPSGTSLAGGLPDGVDYLAPIGEGDRPAPNYLLEFAEALQGGAFELLYADDDRDGAPRSDPRLKPEWSPVLLHGLPYPSPAFAVGRRALEQAGGWTRDDDLTGGYGVLLRLAASTRAVRAIHQVLLHRGGARRPSAEAEAADLRSLAVSGTGRWAVRSARSVAGADRLYDCRFRLRGDPSVTIVIPTRDRLPLLRRCVESLHAKTTYRNYRILIVDNGSTDPACRVYLRRLPHKVIRRPGAFNFSWLNNEAVRLAQSDYVLLLNNDTEVVSPGWIEAMLELAELPGTGCVGARLLYPEGTLQHAGVIFDGEGGAVHFHQRSPGDTAGPLGSLRVAHEVSAVTGACLLVRRSLYLRVGGLDPKLAVAFQDIDLCMKLRAEGLRVVWTPHATLVHHESASRAGMPEGEAAARFRGRWGVSGGPAEPYVSPLYTLRDGVPVLE